MDDDKTPFTPSYLCPPANRANASNLEVSLDDPQYGVEYERLDPIRAATEAAYDRLMPTKQPTPPPGKNFVTKAENRDINRILEHLKCFKELILDDIGPLAQAVQDLQKQLTQTAQLQQEMEQLSAALGLDIVEQ